MALTRPTTVRYPFATEAAGANINVIPDAPTGSYTASWRQGFPPITMTPLAGGGSPPVGADFNGVLNSLSANVRWLNAGGWAAYDAALSAVIGGYPKGAVLVLNDGMSLVMSTVIGNTNDPNSGFGGSTGWAPCGGALAGAGNYIASGASDSGGTVYSVTPQLPQGAPTNGNTITFSTNTTNTGACTLSVGGVAHALCDASGAALTPGVIGGGRVFTAVYDAGSAKWLLLQNPPATTAMATAGAATQHFLSPSHFGGASRVHAVAAGYQKLPGGLILMWGRSTVTLAPGGGVTTITLPLTCPTELLCVTTSNRTTSGGGLSATPLVVTDYTTTGFTAKNYDPDTSVTEWHWFAIGY